MGEKMKIPQESDEPPLRPGEVRLQSVEAITVPHMEEAMPAPVSKTIHPRRPLPLVPEKPEQGTE